MNGRIVAFHPVILSPNQVNQANSPRVSNVETNVIASGDQTHAVAPLLVYESPRRGDLVVPAGRLRDGFPDDMDSGKILTLRMGGAVALPELQLSLAGRHLPSGAKLLCD